VLVVGAGNSGAQIALELSRFHDVALAGREVGRLPRTILGADVFRWIWPVFRHLNVETWLGRGLQRRMRTSDPLIGIGPRDFESAGVRRLGPVTGVHQGLPSIGGAPVNARTIVWATGFTHDFGWINVPALQPDGRPRHRRGVSEPPGLYFLGLRFQYRQSSALIGGVGDDAEFVTTHILQRS
jgi:putative flavoprotein involved in K+ transport